MRTNTQEAVLSAYIASIGKRAPRGHNQCEAGAAASKWMRGLRRKN